MSFTLHHHHHHRPRLPRPCQCTMLFTLHLPPQFCHHHPRRKLLQRYLQLRQYLMLCALRHLFKRRRRRRPRHGLPQQHPLTCLMSHIVRPQFAPRRPCTLRRRFLPPRPFALLRPSTLHHPLPPQSLRQCLHIHLLRISCTLRRRFQLRRPFAVPCHLTVHRLSAAYRLPL